MKTITFPPGVHLVTLEGNTTSEDFLSAFQYENRYVEHINPTLSPVRELDFSKDCCPVFLLLSRREDVERFIDRLNRLSTQHSATIFVFISNPSEYLYEERMSFTTILTYDKSINGGIVERGVGHIHEGPYTIDPPHSPIEGSPRENPFDNIDEDWQDRAPSDPQKPAETATKISDLVKTSQGFHRLSISPQNADAIVRQQKKDIVYSAEFNIQKGDYIVFIVGECNSYHINSMVFEVSFVSAIPHSSQLNGYSQVSISFNRLPNAKYHEGDISGDFLQDTIVFTTP